MDDRRSTKAFDTYSIGNLNFEPRIYDVGIDAFRPATQEDVDLLMARAGAYARLRQTMSNDELQRRLNQTSIGGSNEKTSQAAGQEYAQGLSPEQPRDIPSFAKVHEAYDAEPGQAGEAGEFQAKDQVKLLYSTWHPDTGLIKLERLGNTYQLVVDGELIWHHAEKSDVRTDPQYVALMQEAHERWLDDLLFCGGDHWGEKISGKTLLRAIRAAGGDVQMRR